MLAARLKKILESKTLVSPEADGSVTLREQDVMDVSVLQIPERAATVNLQHIGDFSGVKNGRWKQRCDYMFALDQVDGSEVVFVELKKSLDTGKEKAMEQLRRSPPVLMYLKSLCQLEEQCTDEGVELRLRYFVISERYGERLDKQRVRPNRRPETEQFKSIQVGIVVGGPLTFASLFSG
ncbi:MAG: hypothetical protein F4210_06120 [Holophagales bacterium]|nr:hypothetical protein [Holophagales bacterium]MYF95072.1 hypothetical protein [Holophagales bacterium]